MLYVSLFNVSFYWPLAIGPVLNPVPLLSQYNFITVLYLRGNTGELGISITIITKTLPLSPVPLALLTCLQTQLNKCVPTDEQCEV